MDLFRMDYKENRYDAEMIDSCTKGLSLMTNEKLVLGEFVYVELKNCDTNVPPAIKKQNNLMNPPQPIVKLSKSREP